MRLVIREQRMHGKVPYTLATYRYSKKFRCWQELNVGQYTWPSKWINMNRSFNPHKGLKWAHGEYRVRVVGHYTTHFYPNVAWIHGDETWVKYL